MPTLFPHQRQGALFLSQRRAALLADEQRVGKTAAAVTACDYVFARYILVITKSSARAQWGYEFRQWGWPRKIQVLYTGSDKLDATAEVVIVGWGMVYDARLLPQLMARKWDVIIPDESHEAKNPEAKRTKALYGTVLDEGIRLTSGSLSNAAVYVWPLTGTPVPNAPNDLYPALRALAPERLAANAARGWPCVASYETFVKRYCVVRPKTINGHRIQVVVGGKNEDELRDRLQGFWLRRTQADVGIGQPIFSVFSIAPDRYASDSLKEVLAKIQPYANQILAAAEAGKRLGEDQFHLGTLRRITGEIKAWAVVEAMKEELDDGLDRIVLMAWHTDVIDVLKKQLAGYGVAGIDGRTPAIRRQSEVDAFQKGDARVFVGQILAAGEAIDLSASCNLLFVEPSFTPKDMSQAAMRITNHSQKRQALVRVCALEGSIDEALMSILTRKVATIKQIMEN